MEQKWQEAGEDKMPSAKTFFYLLSQQGQSQLKHPNHRSLFYREHSPFGVYSGVNWTNYYYFIINANFILLL